MLRQKRALVASQAVASRKLLDNEYNLMGNAFICKCVSRSALAGTGNVDANQYPEAELQIANRYHEDSSLSPNRGLAFGELNKRMHSSPLKQLGPDPPVNGTEEGKRSVSGSDIGDEAPLSLPRGTPATCSGMKEKRTDSSPSRCRQTEPTASFTPVAPRIGDGAGKESATHCAGGAGGGGTTYVVDLDKLLPNYKQKSVYLSETLEKYHPGFTLSFVARVCEVSNDFFQYYSVASRHFKLPLLRLELADVQSVSKVHVNVPATYCDILPARRGTQFEILMRPGWTLARSKLALQESFPLTLKSHHAVLHRARRRNLFAGRSQSLGGYPLRKGAAVQRANKVDCGHLMPRPLLLRKLAETKRVTAGRETEKKERWVVDGVTFEGEKEAREYMQYVKENAAALARVSPPERIETKSPNKWISGISGFHTWNNRELEWYLAEERMLFVATTAEECSRWVFLLNWLLARNGGDRSA